MKDALADRGTIAVQEMRLQTVPSAPAIRPLAVLDHWLAAIHATRSQLGAQHTPRDHPPRAGRPLARRAGRHVASEHLYLTNFTGSAAIVVLTADRLLFLTDFRYVTSVREARGTATECPGLELVTLDGSYDATLARALQRLRMRAGRVRGRAPDGRPAHLADGDRHRAAPGGRLHARADRGDRRARACAEGRVRDWPCCARRRAGCRGRRRQGVRRGAARANRARGGAGHRLAASGEAGFEQPAFETIVASGPNAALPHARPGERKLTEGDLVVLDFGGVYDSYCVDLTRTVSRRARPRRGRGRCTTRCCDAHDRAIAAVAPGPSRFEIDARRAATRSTARAWPRRSATAPGTASASKCTRIRASRGAAVRTCDTSDEAVAAGMVFTIEPGAYFPGWGGVRIEDDVLVTADGVERPDRRDDGADRDLSDMGIRIRIWRIGSDRAS